MADVGARLFRRRPAEVERGLDPDLALRRGGGRSRLPISRRRHWPFGPRPRGQPETKRFESADSDDRGLDWKIARGMRGATPARAQPASRNHSRRGKYMQNKRGTAGWAGGFGNR